MTQNEKITISLPFELIENPNVVWVDDKKIDDIIVESSPDGNRLIIPLGPSLNKITILGSHVIPEFEIAVMILVVSIFGMILASKTHSLNSLNVVNP